MFAVIRFLSVPATCSVYLRDASAQAALHAATLWKSLKIKHANTPIQRYTDTRPTSLSSNPITPDAWQGSFHSMNF